MPIKKRLIKKKPKYVSWYNQKYSVTDIAYKAYNLAKYMKGMINCERNTYDINHVPNSLNTAYAGNVIQLVAPAQGDDYNARTGRSILYKGSKIRMKFVINPSAVSTNVRVMIVRDPKNLGINPTLADILETGTTQNCTISPRLASSMNRFRVLYDNTFNMQTVNIASKELYINIRKTFHIKFNSSSTNPNTNSVWMLICCDETTNVPVYSMHARSYFYDN